MSLNYRLLSPNRLSCPARCPLYLERVHSRPTANTPHQIKNHLAALWPVYKASGDLSVFVLSIIFPFSFFTKCA